MLCTFQRGIASTAAGFLLACALVVSGCESEGSPFAGCDTSNLNACPQSGGYNNPYPAQLELMSWEETLRKASLELTGRLPSDQQVQVTRGNDQLGLEASLWEMMRTELFLDRLKELYNDHFLTDKYLGDENAVELLSEDVYPNLRWFENSSEQVQLLTNDSIAREALELIAHVVRNDRPFTEILTANYTIANGYSATSFIGIPGVPLQIENPEAFQPIAVPGIPHAGILTSPMFLNRFPTSDTNVNRHRARMAYYFFLDVDINQFGTRPVDADEIEGENPTLNDPACTVCHTTMDPVAGLFMNWDEQGVYENRGGWREDMLPPGFAGTDLPQGQYGSALRWFAQQVAQHPRFAVATVKTMFEGLTGQKVLVLASDTPENTEPPVIDPPTDDGGVPLPPPGLDPTVENQALERAYNQQQQTLNIMRDRFIAANYDVKVLVREIVLSPYFRAKNSMPLDAEQEIELSTYGTARFLTPEHLNRKIEATTGVKWRQRPDREDYLLDQYRIFYGGIDSDLVTKRITEPNGVMASLALRMAYEVSCSAVPYDFSKPASQRVLFPNIDTNVTPTSDEARVREAIQYLHNRLIGENVATNSPEVDETFQILTDAWSIGASGIGNDTVSQQLAGPCRLNQDRITGADLPESQRINRDDNYAIRAWMAATSYLLSDYRFLFE